MGGIVGKIYISGLIEKCINNGAITTTSNENRYLGGIIGYLSSGNVVECANKGCCTRRNINTVIGGICGRLDNRWKNKELLCYWRWRLCYWRKLWRLDWPVD